MVEKVSDNKLAPKQDFEALTVIISVAIFIALAALVATFPGWQELSPTPVVKLSGSQKPQTEAEKRLAARFTQAVSMLHAKQYEYAIAALDAVLEMSPNLPEAYVNMGYAFIGLEEYGPARGAFEKAIDLKLDQVNAYYGLAIAVEGAGELEAALGSMRTYIHLSKPNDPYLARARSALWEWETQLGRGEGAKSASKEETPSPAIKEEVPSPAVGAPARGKGH